MIIVYDSRTGNVDRFVGKLGMNSVRLEEQLQLDEPYVLITYTTGFGQVPDKTKRFLLNNHSKLQGVAASGNRNWGSSFAGSADKIAESYGVPIVAKFELSGTVQDIEQFRVGVDRIAACSVK